ncbi:unnamed protein product [Boreogadus saida]
MFTANARTVAWYASQCGGNTMVSTHPQSSPECLHHSLLKGVDGQYSVTHVHKEHFASLSTAEIQESKEAMDSAPWGLTRLPHHCVGEDQAPGIMLSVISDPAVLLCCGKTTEGRQHRAWVRNQQLQGV